MLYRLVGLARDSGTQVDFTEDNRLFIAPAVTWRPTVDTTLTILGQYQKAESGFFNFLPARGTFLPNPNGVISTSFYGDRRMARGSIDLRLIPSWQVSAGGRLKAAERCGDRPGSGRRATSHRAARAAAHRESSYD